MISKLSKNQHLNSEEKAATAKKESVLNVQYSLLIDNVSKIRKLPKHMPVING